MWLKQLLLVLCIDTTALIDYIDKILCFSCDFISLALRYKNSHSRMRVRVLDRVLNQVKKHLLCPRFVYTNYWVYFHVINNNKRDFGQLCMHLKQIDHWSDYI